jgi:hypothetical protein
MACHTSQLRAAIRQAGRLPAGKRASRCVVPRPITVRWRLGHKRLGLRLQSPRVMPRRRCRRCLWTPAYRGDRRLTDEGRPKFHSIASCVVDNPGDVLAQHGDGERAGRECRRPHWGMVRSDYAVKQRVHAQGRGGFHPCDSRHPCGCPETPHSGGRYRMPRAVWRDGVLHRAD